MNIFRVKVIACQAALIATFLYYRIPEISKVLEVYEIDISGLYPLCFVLFFLWLISLLHKGKHGNIARGSTIVIGITFNLLWLVLLIISYIRGDNIYEIIVEASVYIIFLIIYYFALREEKRFNKDKHK